MVSSALIGRDKTVNKLWQLNFNVRFGDNKTVPVIVLMFS